MQSVIIERYKECLKGHALMHLSPQIAILSSASRIVPNRRLAMMGNPPGMPGPPAFGHFTSSTGPTPCLAQELGVGAHAAMLLDDRVEALERGAPAGGAYEEISPQSCASVTRL